MLHPSDQLCGPPQDSLQQLDVSPVLGPPELDAVLQVGSHKSGVEGQDHLPRPAGHTAFDAAQDTVGFLGCKCAVNQQEINPLETKSQRTWNSLFGSVILNRLFHRVSQGVSS